MRRGGPTSQVNNSFLLPRQLVSTKPHITCNVRHPAYTHTAWPRLLWSVCPCVEVHTLHSRHYCVHDFLLGLVHVCMYHKCEDGYIHVCVTEHVIGCLWYNVCVCVCFTFHRRELEHDVSRPCAMRTAMGWHRVNKMSGWQAMGWKTNHWN